ncbi:hypothetical protein [Chryseolinea sp. H1M3-3]|uniref:hypothetical protein n=1 Tax=Chryseolinea sp. H1M3-3 TaxID=3034144 RepID=UPI0023EB95FD|nr:hypothetical protein [Chryseolinea sp. H1M3-3]
MDLETYLTSKRIDSAAFQTAEPELWKSWRYEFEQMHPNSFTVQKLNLINPIRRKYPLKSIPEKIELNTATPPPASATPGVEPKPVTTSAGNPKPSIPKPVFKPKPKMS